MHVSPALLAEIAEESASYAEDPLGWVLWAFDWGKGDLADWPSPKKWQCEFFEQLGEQIRARGFTGRTVPPILMTTASGHGPGKTAVTAKTILFLMSTRPFAVGTVTASTYTQLQNRTWSELGKWRRRAITGEMFRFHSSMGNLLLYHKDYPESWKVLGQTATKENAQSFAGQHADGGSPFYIFDEASAVPDEIFEVAQGGLTDGEPFFFLFGNPERNDGFFHDATFGALSHRWSTRSIDSRTVERAPQAMFSKWVEDYGEDSDFVRVRVRGLPPKAASDQYIPSGWVADARTAPVEDDDGAPLIIGIDHAGPGEDATVFAYRRGFDARTIKAELFRGLTREQLVEMICRRITRYQPAAVNVDAQPIGVAESVRARGFHMVEGVNFGGKAHNQRAFPNRAHEMAHELREWFREGGKIEDNDKWQKDLCGRKIAGIRDGKVHLLDKAKCKVGGVEMDYFDAMSLTFARHVARLDVSGFEYDDHQAHFDPLEDF